MTIRLIPGDCRDVLPTLAARSVQCVVTSPPYYGLRDYGVAGQIGLEATPDDWLATMVQVMREVKRVLRDDGTCWVNMGDSYASATKSGGRNDGGRRCSDGVMLEGWKETPKGMPRAISHGVKDKDLLMMPARLALALQADGWWLRSDIIWAKPNPMPESVTDRPTSAHEHIFLLTKRSRYYYDTEAVREEELVPGATARQIAYQQRLRAGNEGRKGDLVNDSVGAWKGGEGAGQYAGGRNCRNVWTIATAPYSDAHFATYPPALAERCIKAGTSERGACAHCGKPWQRIVDRPSAPAEVFCNRSAPVDGFVHAGASIDGEMRQMGSKLMKWRNENPSTTTGWAAACQCNADVVPCVVLDPFAGAGTTLLVADRLQRDAIGIELNTAYTEMAMQRCRNDAPLFSSWAPAEDPEDERMRDLFEEAAD